MHTTLIKLKEFKPYKEAEIKLLKSLGKKTADDCKLEFSTILKAIGIEDAVWCLSVLSLKEVSMFNARVAEISLPIFEKQYPNDMRVREAIQGSKDYFNGVIEVEDLRKLKTAARAAIGAAARAAAWDTAKTAAGDTARASARDAAGSLVWEASGGPVESFTWDTAYNAAWDTIWNAAWNTAWEKVEVIFKEEFC